MADKETDQVTEDTISEEQKVSGEETKGEAGDAQPQPAPVEATLTPEALKQAQAALGTELAAAHQISILGLGKGGGDGPTKEQVDKFIALQKNPEWVAKGNSELDAGRQFAVLGVSNPTQEQIDHLVALQKDPKAQEQIQDLLKRASVAANNGDMDESHQLILQYVEMIAPESLAHGTPWNVASVYKDIIEAPGNTQWAPWEKPNGILGGGTGTGTGTGSDTGTGAGSAAGAGAGIGIVKPGDTGGAKLGDGHVDDDIDFSSPNSDPADWGQWPGSSSTTGLTPPPIMNAPPAKGTVSTGDGFTVGYTPPAPKVAVPQKLDDGTVIYTVGGIEVERVNPDGSRTKTLPDGTKVNTDPNGNETSRTKPSGGDPPAEDPPPEDPPPEDPPPEDPPPEDPPPEEEEEEEEGRHVNPQYDDDSGGGYGGSERPDPGGWTDPAEPEHEAPVGRFGQLAGLPGSLGPSRRDMLGQPTNPGVDDGSGGDGGYEREDPGGWTDPAEPELDDATGPIADAARAQAAQDAIRRFTQNPLARAGDGGVPEGSQANNEGLAASPDRGLDLGYEPPAAPTAVAAPAPVGADAAHVAAGRQPMPAATADDAAPAPTIEASVSDFGEEAALADDSTLALDDLDDLDDLDGGIRPG